MGTAASAAAVEKGRLSKISAHSAAEGTIRRIHEDLWRQGEAQPSRRVEQLLDFASSPRHDAMQISGGVARASLLDPRKLRIYVALPCKTRGDEAGSKRDEDESLGLSGVQVVALEEHDIGEEFGQSVGQGWLRHVTDDRQEYYYHRRTRATSWLPPKARTETVPDFRGPPPPPPLGVVLCDMEKSNAAKTSRQDVECWLGEVTLPQSVLRIIGTDEEEERTELSVRDGKGRVTYAGDYVLAKCRVKAGGWSQRSYEAVVVDVDERRQCVSVEFVEDRVVQSGLPAEVFELSTDRRTRENRDRIAGQRARRRHRHGHRSRRAIMSFQLRCILANGVSAGPLSSVVSVEVDGTEASRLLFLCCNVAAGDAYRAMLQATVAGPAAGQPPPGHAGSSGYLPALRAIWEHTACLLAFHGTEGGKLAKRFPAETYQAVDDALDAYKANGALVDTSTGTSVRLWAALGTAAVLAEAADASGKNGAVAVSDALQELMQRHVNLRSEELAFLLGLQELSFASSLVRQGLLASYRRCAQGLRGEDATGGKKNAAGAQGRVYGFLHAMPLMSAVGIEKRAFQVEGVADATSPEHEAMFQDEMRRMASIFQDGSSRDDPFGLVLGEAKISDTPEHSTPAPLAEAAVLVCPRLRSLAPLLLVRRFGDNSSELELEVQVAVAEALTVKFGTYRWPAFPHTADDLRFVGDVCEQQRAVFSLELIRALLESPRLHVDDMRMLIPILLTTARLASPEAPWTELPEPLRRPVAVRASQCSASAIEAAYAGSAGRGGAGPAPGSGSGILARLRYWSDVVSAMGETGDVREEHQWLTRGYLQKTGNKNRYAWKKRYYVLRGSALHYFSTEEEAAHAGEPKGVIRLAGVRSLDAPTDLRSSPVGRRSSGRSSVSGLPEASADELHGFECDVLERSRPTLAVYATSAAERDAWVRAIRRALHAEERVVTGDDGIVTEEWFELERKGVMGWSRVTPDFFFDDRSRVQRHHFGNEPPRGWEWVSSEADAFAPWALRLAPTGNDPEGWDEDFGLEGHRRRRYIRQRRRHVAAPRSFAASATTPSVALAARPTLDMDAQGISATDLVVCIARDDAAQISGGQELEVLRALSDLSSMDNLHESMQTAIDGLSVDAVRACEPSRAFGALVPDLKKPLAGPVKFRALFLKTVLQLIETQRLRAAQGASTLRFAALWRGNAALWTDFMVWFGSQDAAGSIRVRHRGAGAAGKEGYEDAIATSWNRLGNEALSVKASFLRQARRVLDGTLSPRATETLVSHPVYPQLIEAFEVLGLRIYPARDAAPDAAVNMVDGEMVARWASLGLRDGEVRIQEVLEAQRGAIEASQACLAVLETICAELLEASLIHRAVVVLQQRWASMRIEQLLGALHLPQPKFRMDVAAIGVEVDEVALEAEQKDLDEALGTDPRVFEGASEVKGSGKDADDEKALEDKAVEEGDDNSEAFKPNDGRPGAAEAKGRDEASGGEDVGKILGPGETAVAAEVRETTDFGDKLRDDGDAPGYVHVASATMVAPPVARAARATLDARFRSSSFGSDSGLQDLADCEVPLAFIHARSWLLALKDVRLFREVWRSTAGEAMPRRLFVAAERWTGIFDELDTSRFTVSRARDILRAAGSKEKVEEELKMLAQTRVHPTEREPSRPWVVDAAADVKWVKRSIREIFLFEKLVAIADRLDTILSDDFKRFMDAFLEDDARVERDGIWSLFVEMKARFREDMTLQEISHLDLGGSIEGSAERLLALPLDFLIMLPTVTDVLVWLQSCQNLHTDDDFAQSLEVCRGKGELERPDELLDGDVMESKLAALSVVRNAFHGFLFRDAELFPHVTDLLQSLVGCSAVLATRDVRDAVQQCTEVLRAFIEVFDDDSDMVAPNRLRAFHDPSRHTVWEICHLGEDTDVTIEDLLTLRYELRRGGVATQIAQNVSELMDFQSVLVLASTRSGDEKVQTMVDEFTSQLEYLRRVTEVMYDLHLAGHPAYRGFRFLFPLETPAADLLQQVRGLSQLAENWRERVARLREDHYFVNFVSMNLIWDLVGQLRAAREGDEAAGQSVVDFFSLFGYAVDAKAAVETWALLGGEGEALATLEGATGEGVDVDDELECFARWITSLLVAQPRPQRILPADALSRVHETTSTDMKPGLNVVVVDDPAYTLDHVLSLYAQHGRLPEREELHFCSAHGTRIEDVQNLVARWAGAPDQGRGDGLYVVVSVEQLSFEQQRTLGEQIQRVLFSSEAVAAAAAAKKADDTEGEGMMAKDLGMAEDADEDVDYDESAKDIDFDAESRAEGIGAAEAKGDDAGVVEAKEAKVGSSRAVRRRATLSAHMARLVLLVGGTRPQYLAEQFQQHRRVNVKTVGAEILQDVTEHISGTEGRPVTVYCSATTGGGKTFRVLSDAESDHRRVTTVPVHKFMRPDALVKHLDASFPKGSAVPEPRTSDVLRNIFGLFAGHPSTLSTRSKHVLHLDLSATTPPSFDTTLAEMVLFGGVLDTATGARFAWLGGDLSASRDIRVAIEIADTGARQTQPPRICALLPTQRVAVGRESFRASAPLLEAGFVGFRSARGDGSTEERHCATTANTAYVRLQTVCKVLRLLQEGDGLPAEFDAKVLPEMVNDDCFGLLMNAMELPQDAAPNMHQVWAFVNVLFWQLCDLHHESSIANSVAWSEALDSGSATSTFKGHLVRFLVKTARDITAPAVQHDDSGELQVVPWQASNHEFVCFQVSGNRTRADDGGGLSFLSLDPVVMRRNMNATFRQTTEGYGIVIGEDLDSLLKRHAKVLNIITGNRRSDEECNQLLGGHYCMTGDSVLKMVAIFVRIRCGIPAVLMGECGCGKTELIRYTCAYLGATLLILDCHGGTEEKEIIEIFDRANAMAEARFGASITTTQATGPDYPESDDDDDGGDELVPGSRVVIVGMAGFEGKRGRLLCFDDDAITYGHVLLDDTQDNIMVEKAELKRYHRPRDEPPAADPELGRRTSIGASEVFVFLDEINTCAHMGLITELIMKHSMYGRPLHNGVQVVAALNPYRMREKGAEATTGLVFQARDVAADPMAALVYRVHPIPRSLLSYIYDFGALMSRTERLYIYSMTRRQLPLAPEREVDTLARLLLASQRFIRDKDGDASAVSLRDVRRALHLVHWFDDINNEGNPRGSVRGEQLWVAEGRRCVFLALALVYYYRLRAREDRAAYCALMEEHLEGAWGKRSGEMRRFIEEEQDKYAVAIDFEDGIARNEALKENLFVTITCIANLIPVFVVGKPGSSKTLTMQVIQSNLQGERSRNPFWRQFPQVSTFPYQCSPLSTAHGIRVQYDKACAFQQSQTAREQADGTDVASQPQGDGVRRLANTTILLLDEVGLAEHSPDLPLKVLHKILVEKRISVVGLSNWVLDPAKMNRAVLLHRPDPTQDDLRFTGQAISGAVAERDGLNERLLNTLAQAYHAVYSAQEGRDFIGMRDYYHLLKFLRGGMRRGRRLDAPLLIRGLCRNFSGKPQVLNRVLRIFEEECRQHVRNWDSRLRPTSRELLEMNLADRSARHLMLITVNGAALPVMFGCGLLRHETAEVLVGSQFPDDQSELALVQAINKVKNAMGVGRTVVLMQHENIYEALYDVLNQRYVLKRQQDGSYRRMLRLAVGAHSQLCPCHDDFKVVVIVEEEDAYERLDLPLLNRFEKQVFGAEAVVSTAQSIAVRALSKWVQRVQEECRGVATVFHGFHRATLASLVLTATDYNDAELVQLSAMEEYAQGRGDFPESVGRVAAVLAHCATPLAYWRSPTLQEALPRYFTTHGSLASLVADILDRPKQPLRFKPENEWATTVAPSVRDELDITLTTVRTFSPVTHLDEAMAELRRQPALQTAILHEVLHLASFTSEREIAEQLRRVFFSDTLLDPSVLIIQCDAATASASLVNHVRLLCDQLRDQRRHWPMARAAHLMDEVLARFGSRPGGASTPGCVPVFPVHVFFVVHMPAAARRTAAMPLDYLPGMREYFVDDIRPEGADIGGVRVLTTQEMLERSTYELTSEFGVSVSEVARSTFRAALSFVLVPLIERRHDKKTFVSWYPARIQMMLSLFEDDRFMALFNGGISYILQAQHQGSNATLGSLLTSLHGSLRQTLEELVGQQIKKATTLLLAHWDRNFNLALLWESLTGIPEKLCTAEATPSAPSLVDSVTNFFTGPAKGSLGRNPLKAELWFAMIEGSERGAWSAAALQDLNLTLQLSGAGTGSGAHLQSVDVANDGRHGFLVGHFPFSHKFARFMDARQTREHIYRIAAEAEYTGGGDGEEISLSERLLAYVAVAFGERATAVWGQWDVVAYLHDYVGIAAPQYPGLDLDLLMTVYRCVACRAMPQAMASPAHLHVALWGSEEQLFALCSLLSNAGLQPALRQELEDVMLRMTASPSSAKLEVLEAHTRLLSLEILRTVLHGLLDSFNAGPTVPPGRKAYDDAVQWSSDVGKLRAALGPQIAMLQAQLSTHALRSAQTALIEDVLRLHGSVGVLRIFTEEVLIGDLMEEVPRSVARVVGGIRIAPGMRGLFRFKGDAKKDFAGTITQIHRDGTFDILYDDRDFEQRANVWQLRLPRDTRVIADYNGSGRLMTGSIQRWHYYGAYDVYFDAGYYEQRVDRFRIQLETPEIEEVTEDPLPKILAGALRSQAAADLVAAVKGGQAGFDLQRKAHLETVLQHAVGVAAHLVSSREARNEAFRARLGASPEREVQRRGQRFLRDVLCQLALPRLFPEGDGAASPARVARELDDLVLNILVGHESFCGHALQAVGRLGAPLEFLRRSVLQFLVTRGNVAAEELAYHKVESLVRGVVRSQAGAERDNECSICLDVFDNPHTTSCNHVFCKECIDNWLATNADNACPLCRQPTQVTGPFEVQQQRFTGIQVIQLMVQLEADLRVALLDAEGGGSNSLANRDVAPRTLIDAPIEGAIETHGLRRTVHLLSRIQVDLQRYAQRLSGARGRPLPPAPFYMAEVSAVAPPTDLYWARIFVLRILVQRAGEQAVRSLAARSDAPGWLAGLVVQLDLALNGEAVPTLDMAYTLATGDRYPRVLTAVRSGVDGFGVDAAEMLCLDHTDLRSLVLCAVARLRMERVCGTAAHGGAEVPPEFSRWLTGGGGVLGAARPAMWQGHPDGAVRGAAAQEGPLFNLFLHGPADLRDAPCLALAAPHSSAAGLQRAQVAVVLAATALAEPRGWFYAVLLQPQTQAESFVPTMPEDETAAVVAALDRSAAGARRAYRCACGALYFIGNCGQAWVRGRCPECGAAIGGESHNLLSGNKAVTDNELKARNDEKGYCRDVIGGEGNQFIGRTNITQVTVRVLRFFLHTALSMHAGFGRRLGQAVRTVVYGANGGGTGLEQTAAFVAEKALEDWAALGTHLSLNDAELARFLCAVLQRYRAAGEVAPATFGSARDRQRWETRFEKAVIEPLVENVAGLVIQVERLVEGLMGRAGAGVDLVAAGMLLAHEVHETAVDPEPESAIWRYRRPLRYDDFVARFYRVRDHPRDYPIIDVVIQDEAPLSVVRHLPAILQWHAVLFELYPDGSLSRQDAMETTNGDALQMVPEERRGAVERVFEDFCEAFNAAFHLLENLYECNANPYRDMLMDRDRPLAFSLPSRNNQGAQSAEGMCTVALADMLAARHNEVLSRVATSTGGAGGDGAEGEGDEDEEVLIPTAQLLSLSELPPTTHLTSPELLKLWLCVYEREKHMLPLLYSCARQGLELGRGRDISYDFKQVASGLRALLVTGKQPVNLHLRLFVFRGESLRSGVLAKLETRLAQTEVPESMREAIRGELQDGQASRQLLSLLETCVSFLSSGAGGARDMELSSFVTRVLLVEAAKWDDMSTATLRSPEMRLCHLKGIYLCVSAALSDETPLAKVEAKYKVPLPPDSAELLALRQCLSSRRLDVAAMVAQLEAALTERLGDGAQLSADLLLHDANGEGFLDFHFEYGGGTEPAGYAEHFPLGLPLRYTFAIYLFLKEAAEGRATKTSAADVGVGATASSRSKSRWNFGLGRSRTTKGPMAR